MKHKLSLFEGCTDGSTTIDGEDTIKGNSEIHPLLRPILAKYITECKDVRILQSLFIEMLEDIGEYTALGQCEACGEWNSEYNLDFEL